jgi:glycerophosphoryl diester phosphodiesterase
VSETARDFPSVTDKLHIAPLILGHRGASAVAPENTLAAFSRAIRDGADGIEFDVRLSRDGVPVVIHDGTLRRTAGIDGRVSQLTAAELQEVDVGRWFAQQIDSIQSHVPERLPNLAQVFELYNSNPGVLYVEMKCEAGEVGGGAALAKAVVELTRASGMADRVVVESFDLAAIAEVKRLNASIRTAALFEPKLSRPISTLRRLKMVEAACRVGADEIALHHTLAGKRVVDKAKQAGLEVVLWTVDDPDWIPRARSLGVKALIANNPATMVRHRS